MPFPFSNGDVYTASDVNGLNRMPPNEVVTSRSLALTDESKWLRVNGGVAMTLTIPNSSSVAFEIGAQILVSRETAQTVTIVRDTGVSLNGVLFNRDYQIGNRYGFVSLLYSGSNSWYIMGDVA